MKDDEVVSLMLRCESSSSMNSGDSTANTSTTRLATTTSPQCYTWGTMGRLATPLMVLNLVSVTLNSGFISCYFWGGGLANLSPAYKNYENSNNNYTSISYTRYSKIIGHLHMAKTAGSEINGELAAHYERACGCKGYSYDAFQFNERIREKANTTGVTIDVNNGGPDIISEQIEGKNRGRVPLYIMFEVGFEDCDYISLESDWSVWSRIALAAALELHVPCRDPLDHLMSQCNHRRIDFDCETTNLRHQVQKCFVKPTRFHANLTLEHEMSLRCFNPTPIEPYLEYMDQFLERKRIETSYYHRDSNTPRKKDKECIWQHPEIKERVLEILYESDYYRWCNNCIGSENELVLQHQR